jgi:group I intron endonuclease
MFIYKTTNLVNKKIYIGKYEGIKRNYLGSGKLLRRAIEKYGKESFIREIIEDNITNKKILREREIFWIEYYDSTNLDIGYNLTKGGDGSLGCSPSEETREKISQSGKGRIGWNKGLKMSDEFKKKISQVTSGSCNANYGKPRSEETKKKISDSKQNISEETRKKLSISLKGKITGRKHSEESRKKMSESKKGKPRIQNNNGILNKENKYYSSLYTGVSFNKKNKNWKSRIAKDGKTYYLGVYKTEEEAAEAYNKKALELYGQNAKLNIIEEK